METQFHVIDLLPEYTLGMLEEGEVERVEEHLGTCEYCRAELQAYREVAGLIAMSAKQFEPPAHVKTELMARVKGDIGEAEGGEMRRSIWEKLSGFFAALSPAWTVASLALILLLAASNLLLWGEVNRLQQGMQLNDMRVIALEGTGAAPGATGLIVASVNGEHGTLVVDQLPVLDEEHQYQLWLIKDGQRTSGGVFSVSSDGYGSVWVSAPEPLLDYPDFGVTIEPEGGSPGPTGEKVLGGGL
jgi:anti-sigma-K factor RskA